MTFNRPERYTIYKEIIYFLEYEVRYYKVSAAYYANDIESLEADPNNDLLFLTTVIEISPRIYAQYLQKIDSDNRVNERIIYSCMRDFNKAISQVVESGRV